MRTTMTSVFAFGLALGFPALAAAQQADAQQQFQDAGFEAVTVAQDVEVARIQGDDGETYYVVGGMGMMAAGLGTGTLGTATTGGTTIGAATDSTSGTAAATTGTTGSAGGTTAGTTGAATTGATGTAGTGTTGTTSETGTTDTTTGGTTTGTTTTGTTGTTTTGTTVTGSTTTAGTTGATAGIGTQTLEEQLEAAGIDDYEIIGDATIGRMMVAGDTLYIIHGVHEEN